MKRSRYFKWGIVLLIVCVLAFLAIPIVPFLPIGDGAKVIVAATLFVIGEATFWGGAILVGKELLAKYTTRLNPKNWFKGKPGPRENKPE
ncbi:MAG TPA: transporter suffix domain-containing protein [Prolixibacteraceae bacterium]